MNDLQMYLMCGAFGFFCAIGILVVVAGDSTYGMVGWDCTKLRVPTSELQYYFDNSEPFLDLDNTNHTYAFSTKYCIRYEKVGTYG